MFSNQFGDFIDLDPDSSNLWIRIRIRSIRIHITEFFTVYDAKIFVMPPSTRFFYERQEFFFRDQKVSQRKHRFMDGHNKYVTVSYS